MTSARPPSRRRRCGARARPVRIRRELRQGRARRRYGRPPGAAGLARRRERDDEAQDRGDADVRRQEGRAGEYSLFVDLKSPKEWTLIISSWAAQAKFNPQDKDALWGAYGYTPDKDVARVDMKLDKLPFDVDQLTWTFLDMSNTGGVLAIEWDTVRASVPFRIG